MQITTRKEAADNGQRKYWTGKTCKRGHLTYRSTYTGACSACLYVYKKQYENKINSVFRNRAEGKTEIAIKVDARDVQKLNEFAAALNLARKMQNAIDGAVTNE